MSRGFKCDVWSEFSRAGVAKGVSPSLERAALSESPLGVAAIDGVIPMVNKDIIGGVCYSSYWQRLLGGEV